MHARLTLALTLLTAAVAAPLQAAPAVPSLSYFKPVKGGYTWVRLDHARTETPIATVKATGRPEVSWNIEATQAIVWADNSDTDTAPTAWTVALPKGPAKPLPLPAPRWGDVENIVFDQRERPLALVLMLPSPTNGLTEGQDKQGRFLRFEGKRFGFDPDGQEGQLALAHAFSWQGGGWRRVETKATTTGWDYGRGVDELELARHVRPHTRAMRGEPDGINPVEDAGLLKRLTGLDPQVVTEGGEWSFVRTTGGPVYVWREAGEFLHSTSMLAWGEPTKLTRLPGLAIPKAAERDIRPDKAGLRMVSLQPRGGHVLVSDADGAYPRLYDVKAKARVWSSDTAVGASLWP
jgi:hypothetical protein